MTRARFGSSVRHCSCELPSKRSRVVSYVVVPLVFFCYCFNTIDLASNLVHLFFGSILLLFCLAKTIELAHRVKHWAVLPLAFLVRQFFFVILPISVTPQLQGPYRVGDWYLDSLFEGGLIITIENYTIFLILYFWLKRAKPIGVLPGKHGGCVFLYCTAVILVALGITTKLAFYYGSSSFLGQSFTKYWFALGLTLLIALCMGQRHKILSLYTRVIFAVGLACLVSIPLLGTGSRTMLLTPFFCLLGVFCCIQLERFTLSKVAAGVLMALVFAVVAFSLLAGVRSTSYMTGNVATLGEVKGSVSIDPTDGLRTAMYRLGASAAAAQIVVDDPGEFPTRSTFNMIALMAGSLVSKNIWDIEKSLGMSYGINGRSPGEVMATIIGIEGAASFPLSCDLYLVGGYGGVVLGSVLVGAIIVILIRVLNWLLKSTVILTSLLAGVLFPGFAILETATELASLLFWNMWMLILLCRVLQVFEVVSIQCQNGPSVLDPALTQVKTGKTVRFDMDVSHIERGT